MDQALKAGRRLEAERRERNRRNGIDNRAFRCVVASDLYEAGLTEDGRPFIAEQFFLIVENKKGQRFRHIHNFKGAELVSTPEWDGYEDVRERAEANANALASKVQEWLNEGNVLDGVYWYEMFPVYGSEAWSTGNWEHRDNEGNLYDQSLGLF